MASLQTLAPYLAAGIDVENPAWGRGRLVGLPCFDLNGRTQDAHVHFEFAPPDEVCSGVVELSNVKPVLYALDDKVAVCRAAVGMPLLINSIRTMLPTELEFIASVVDTARALGIALNLPPTEYIRKELPDAA